MFNTLLKKKQTRNYTKLCTQFPPRRTKKIEVTEQFLVWDCSSVLKMHEVYYLQQKTHFLFTLGVNFLTVSLVNRKHRKPRCRLLTRIRHCKSWDSAPHQMPSLISSFGPEASFSQKYTVWENEEEKCWHLRRHYCDRPHNKYAKR